MTTITKNGKYAEKREKECSYCGARFTFDATDLTWIGGECATVTCPQCKEVLLGIFEGDYYKATIPNETTQIL